MTFPEKQSGASQPASGVKGWTFLLPADVTDGVDAVPFRIEEDVGVALRSIWPFSIFLAGKSLP